MTIEEAKTLISEAEKSKSLDIIKDAANKLLEVACDAEAVSDRTEFRNGVDELVSFYADTSKMAFYKAARESENPMHYACVEFAYPAIRVKETRDNDTGYLVCSIEDIMRSCDLGDMHKRIDNFGADRNWLYQAEKLNYHMTVRVAREVNAGTLEKLIKNADCFTMNEIARQLDLGKDPCSKTNILKTLQSVITMMLGEGYKATSHDVNYLLNCYAKDNARSKTAITLASHRALRGYLKKVCYRVLTNGTGYEVEQREFKNK